MCVCVKGVISHMAKDETLRGHHKESSTQLTLKDWQGAQLEEAVTYKSQEPLVPSGFCGCLAVQF